MKDKRIISILMILTIIFAFLGGTLAYLNWQSSESQRTNVVFDIKDGYSCAADGGGDITSNDAFIAPASCTNEKYAIKREVTVSPTVIEKGLTIGMDLWLDINDIGVGLSESENFRYALTTSSISCDGSDGEIIASGNFNGKNIGDKIILLDQKYYKATKNDKYYLYIWLDAEEKSTATQNQTFSLSLGGSCNKIGYLESPVLDEGMVPVTISDTGVVKTISSDDENWYNYYRQNWANMVLVNENATSGVEKSKSREYYLNNPGTEVIESDILAYYVWIPRYKYKIWTTGVSATGQEQPIDIEFELRKEEMSLGTKVDEYRTHPAFWWDDNNNSEVDTGEMLPGIWVGKFETTGSSTIPTVKPNVASLVNQTVSAQFNTSLLFAGGSMNTSTGEVTFGDNTYGLTEITDSHMMKNSEWGAVAYLSHSAYGINEEVRINNYYARSKTLTGCGALTEDEATATTCGIPYGTPSTENNPYPQSTTGNISGIFDMSGGAWEYVMGNYNKTVGSSGFSTYPESKYYDNYITTDGLTACNSAKCYGHSLFETLNWYSDGKGFISTSYPWFRRGGGHDVDIDGGVFNSNNYYGYSQEFTSLRSVLIPNMNYTVSFDVNGGNEWVDISYTSVGEYKFIAPNDGEYQLEVWGAQGGSSMQNGSIVSSNGGYGGYSKGNMVLNVNETIYVNVGGKGGNGVKLGTASGGYNGGGSGSSDGTDDEASGGGGGSTHIATVPGELSNLSNNKSSILIVSGGGGGASWTYATGSGGGIYGGYTTGTSSSYPTQTSGYAFGKGENGIGAADNDGVGGGGGGYYGGYSNNVAGKSSGTGGSGYIGNNLLTDKYMYCYNCTTSDDESTKTYTTENVSAVPIANYAKSGDGAARIRQLSEKDIAYGYKYGNMPIPTRDGYVFAGWYTKPEGGTRITEDNVVDVMNNHTLYARWAVVDLNINYSVNGGTITSSTTSSDGNTTYNWNTNEDKMYLNGELYTSNISGAETINLPNYNDSNFMNITRDGYGIKEGEEWICLSGCKKDNMIFSQDVEYKISDFCDGSNNECNIVLGVKFLEAYTITYDANGGSGAPSNQIKYENSTLILSSIEPVRNGYAFLGWSTDMNATSAIYQSNDEYTVNVGTTLYAVWKAFDILTSYSCANGSIGSEPYDLTYTGNCTVIDDGDSNWRVKFLTNGTLTIISDMKIDSFLVGGGGGGGSGSLSTYYAGGGGGGYTNTKKNITLKKEQSYQIVIGSGGGGGGWGANPGGRGGTTTAFDMSAAGGYGGGARSYSASGGSGGSGGGGTNDSYGGNGGSNGGNGSTNGGKGQGTTTREFGDDTGDLYAGGGGGTGLNSIGSGGSGGGGRGGQYSSGSSGIANTGGGGGGGSAFEGGAGAGSGGSGIVVIRNARLDIGYDFTYTGNYNIIDDGDGNWRIKFLTSGTFTPQTNTNIDVFLVGGGGGGGSGVISTYYAGGGGGGYTTTEKNITLNVGTSYDIVIGAGGGGGGYGGSNGGRGGTSSAFGYSAAGGYGGVARSYSAAGGAGGSGGGGTNDSNGGNGGSDGSNGNINGGTGQGTTTREFGETSGDLYSGGGGGSGLSTVIPDASGGAGGGGGGGSAASYYIGGGSGRTNSGGGGGGGAAGELDSYAGGSGGSGIVVIRNTR